MDWFILTFFLPFSDISMAVIDPLMYRWKPPGLNIKINKFREKENENSARYWKYTSRKADLFWSVLHPVALLDSVKTCGVALLRVIS